MLKSITIRLPAELLAKARRKAAAEGRTLTSLVQDGLRLVLADRRKAKRALPRVSSARGGPAPGFEHLTHYELQELDDIEYVERMKHFR